MRINCFVALALATMAMTAQATIILDDGENHNINSASDDVQVYDSPSGESTLLIVHQDADISSRDGTSVSVFGSSGVGVSGTLQGDLVLSDQSTGRFGSGIRVPTVLGNVVVKGESRLIFRDGTVAGDIQVKDSSWNVGIWGGTLQGDVQCQDECSITIHNGVFQGVLSVEDTGTVSLYGDDFLIDGMPVDYGPISATEGTVSGTLSGGDSLSTIFTISGDGQIVLVPEPSTMLLAATALFGILLCQRRR